jgi:hypothetical protein
VRRVPVPFVFAFAVFAATITAACVPSDVDAATESAVQTVRDLFRAIARSDTDELRRVAPAIAALDSESLDALADAFAPGGTVIDLDSVEIDGRRARVPVRLRSSDGSSTIVVPLTWRRGRWTVDSTLTVTRTFDIVPVTE